ncbi:MAG: hypothetical protein A2X48_01750 [Lentisphaerae bacterium GWF2_49_21]|nr:MAG: hypothetical protein A2X48_01750 [Lentisphaerae bacterium GWF2_49_21]
MSFAIVFSILFVFSTVLFAAEEDDFLKPVGKPPKAKADRQQAGEALPPLPLPATPLRRSEKKSPPSPATLIGKVVWGGYLDHKWEDGQVSRVFDWNMVPADCQRILGMARDHLGMEYKVETVNLSSFDSTPAQIPVLFFSGGRSLNFTDEERAKLRRYMLAGGMLWFDSVVGSPYFYKSALKELATIIPESPARRLPLDQPVFHMLKDTVKVNIKTKNEVEPVLEGVYIGSRLAAVISPYGMGVGWDRTSPELIAKADYYDPGSADIMGLNLLAYAVGWFQVGKSHSRIDIYGQNDLVDDSDPVVFPQIRTDGVWNTEPGAGNRLMRFVSRNTNVKVNYISKAVVLGKDPVDAYPFLFLSGITVFRLSDSEKNALKEYLSHGGYLLASNSLGLSEFDSAFRGNIAAMYPDAKFERIPMDSPIFQKGPYKIDVVEYSPETKAKFQIVKAAYLEGLKINGEYKIIYSPVDIAAGWQGDKHPLSCMYMPDDALKLGANLVSFFMTH